MPLTQRFLTIETRTTRFISKNSSLFQFVPSFERLRHRIQQKDATRDLKVVHETVEVRSPHELPSDIDAAKEKEIREHGGYQNVSPDEGLQTMNVVFWLDDRQCFVKEPLAVDDVVDELLEHDAGAVQQRPDQNVVEESVPDVNEQESDEAWDDLTQWCRPLVTRFRVNVLEQELVESVVEPLPHVRVFMNSADADRRLRHRDSVELAEGDWHAVVDDIFVVEELAGEVANSEERQRVEQFEIEIEHNTVDVEKVQSELCQEEPETKPEQV